MELEAYAVADWPGWRVSRRAERSWWVYRGERYVGEVGVIGTGEWWVRPDGDALPWAAMHGDIRKAVGALASWWQDTHPFGDGLP
jgi:hypothetical protein